MRSVLYRFPDLDDFDRIVQGAGAEGELVLPPGEAIDDGEWVIAIFELGPGRRATSAAARGAALPDGPRLVFEPRDVKRLAHFAAHDARSASAIFCDPPRGIGHPRKWPATASMIAIAELAASSSGSTECPASPANSARARSPRNFASARPRALRIASSPNPAISNGRRGNRSGPNT